MFGNKNLHVFNGLFYDKKENSTLKNCWEKGYSRSQKNIFHLTKNSFITVKR